MAAVSPQELQRSDVFLPLLRANDKSLRTLSLANTHITRPTIDMIGEALKGNKSLQTLDLSNNELRDEDLEYFIDKCLRQNLGLARLNLSGNPQITTQTIERLMDVIRVDNDALTFIDSEGTAIEEEAATDFREMASLNTFPSHFKQQVFRAMRNDQNLFKIELHYNPSDPKVINEVAITTLARALAHPLVEDEATRERNRRPLPVICGDAVPVASAAAAANNGDDDSTSTDKRKQSLFSTKPLANDTVRILKLDDRCCRGERCVQALIPILRTNPYLQTLGLSRNDLGDESVRLICEAIRQFGDKCGLEELDFSYNEITDEGLKTFINCVAENTSLKSVRLLGNRYTLSPPLLEQLLQGTALNCEPSSMKVAVEKIKKGYPKNMTAEEEKAAYVRQNCGEFSDERGILDLQGTDADEEKGPSKGYFTSLGCSTIAAALPTNITVHTIKFQNNHIGPEGAKALAQILEYNPTIVRIDLRNNPITDEGARKLLIALKTNDAVVSLDMTTGCQVSTRLLDEVAAITHLNKQPVPIKEFLGYKFNEAPSDTLDLRRRDMQVRGKWRSLFPQSMQYVLTILSRQPKITRVDLSDNDTLGDEGVLQLIDWVKDPRCKVRRLDISNTSITNETVEQLTAALRSNYSLTSVSVAGNRDITTRPRQSLDEALGLNEFTPAVKDIIPLLKNNIDGITAVSFMRHPDDHYKKELRLPVPAPLGDDTARILFSVLMENTNVRSVTLRNQQISNRGLQYATQCLDVNPHISEINLSNNMIGADGINEFADMLERNTSIKSIDLSGNPIGIDGGNRLLLALQTANRSVRYINLTNCRVREETKRSIEALASFNTQSSSFRHLVLDRISSTRTVFYRGGCDNTEIAGAGGGKGATAFLAGGGRNAISISPDFLGDDAIDSLTMALDSCPRHLVKAIQLPQNHITDEGCRRLLQLLHKHPSIVDVDLSNNPLTDGVAREIAAFLTTHPYVTSFVVGNEQVDDVSKDLLFGTNAADDATSTATTTTSSRKANATKSTTTATGNGAPITAAMSVSMATSKSIHATAFKSTPTEKSLVPSSVVAGNGSQQQQVGSDNKAPASNNKRRQSRFADHIQADNHKLMTAIGGDLLGAGGNVTSNAAGGGIDTSAGAMGGSVASTVAGTANGEADASAVAPTAGEPTSSGANGGSNAASQKHKGATLAMSTLDKTSRRMTAATGPGGNVTTVDGTATTNTTATEHEQQGNSGAMTAYAANAINKAKAAADAFATRCTMSPLALRHIAIAIALNNSSAEFRAAYMALSQQLLRWCELRAHSDKVQKSKMVIGNRAVRNALRQVGGGVDNTIEGSSGIGGGEAATDPVAAAIMRECEDEFLSDHHHHHHHHDGHSGGGGRSSTSSPTKRALNSTATNGGGHHMPAVDRSIIKGAEHISSKKELAQLVAAAAPEVVQFAKLGMGPIQLRLLMNLLVRPMEGIIVNQQTIPNFNARDTTVAATSGLNTSASSANVVANNSTSASLAGSNNNAASGAAGAAPNTSYHAPAPSPAGPITPSVAAIPDGEVLRCHVRGISLSDNKGINDACIELLIKDYLYPVMDLSAVLIALKEEEERQRRILLAGGSLSETADFTNVAGTSAALIASMNRSGISAAGSPTFNGSIRGGGAGMMGASTSNNLNRNASQRQLQALLKDERRDRQGNNLLFLQALILDGCNINGSCLKSIYDLCEENGNLVVVGLENTPLTTAIAAQQDRDEQEAKRMAKEAEAKALAEAEEAEIAALRGGLAGKHGDATPQQQQPRASILIDKLNSHLSNAASSSAQQQQHAYIPTTPEELFTGRSNTTDDSNGHQPNAQSIGSSSIAFDASFEMSKPLADYDTEAELREVLGLYNQARHFIATALAKNRTRMVGLASDELFAAHRIARASGTTMVSTALGNSVMLGSSVNTSAMASARGTGGAGGAMGGAYRTDSANVVYMAGGGNDYSAAFNKEARERDLQRALDGGVAAVTDAANTTSGNQYPRALLPSGGQQGSNTSSTVAVPNLNTNSNVSINNSQQQQRPASRLENSLQYGRALREAIPTSYDDFKASEDCILSDAIAGAPKRVLGHGEHVQQMYRSGHHREAALPKSLKNNTNTVEFSNVAVAGGVGSTNSPTDQLPRSSSSSLHSTAASGKKTLAAGEKYTTVTPKTSNTNGA